jgi:hypothetical protein
MGQSLVDPLQLSIVLQKTIVLLGEAVLLLGKRSDSVSELADQLLFGVAFLHLLLLVLFELCFV